MLKLCEIRWQRIYMHLEIKATESELDAPDLQFFLIDAAGRASAAFQIIRREHEMVLLSLNVTNNGLNQCVENGTFSVLAVSGEVPVGQVSFHGSGELLSSWNHHFLYGANKGCYTVTFLVDEFASIPELRILIFDAAITDRGVSKNASQHHLSLTLIRKYGMQALRAVRNTVRIPLYKMFRICSSGNHILFASEMDDQLAQNMAALYERMKERNLDKTHHIDFFLKRRNGERYSFKNRVQRTFKIYKADTIIIDDYFSFFDHFKLDDNVRLIQIWHAGAGFKGVGYSRWGHYGCPPPECAHRQYSYCISGSKAISSFFSEQFGILDEQIIPTGMPRMDRYVDPENRKGVTANLYKDYPVLRNKKVLLFAPTYRGQGRKTAYYPYELIDFDRLYQLCKEKDAVVLFKMHPWVSSAVPISPEYADRFIDMNRYPNINELFYVTDVLITDYSSSMYEFLLMNKPLLLFPFDKDQFATSRGFHRDYDSNVPGKICMTFEALLEAIRKDDYEFEKVGEFLTRYFDQVDSASSDRVIDWLILDQLPSQYREALQQKRDQVRRIHSLSFTVPPKPNHK